MERFGDKTLEQCLESSLIEYLLKTKTGAMTAVRRNVLQMIIFLFGKETTGEYGFIYSHKEDIAVQQKRCIIFSYLFLEALMNNGISEKAITTHNNLWSQHLQHLASCGNEKAAKQYIRILEDREETDFNIKRFQHQLKTMNLTTGEDDEKTEKGELKIVKFRCRRPNLYERIRMKLKKLF